jgi:hypothetical protein
MYNYFRLQCLCLQSVGVFPKNLFGFCVWNLYPRAYETNHPQLSIYQLPALHMGDKFGVSEYVIRIEIHA